MGGKTHKPSPPEYMRIEVLLDSQVSSPVKVRVSAGAGDGEMRNETKKKAKGDDDDVLSLDQNILLTL
jgi:hypothetical protein